LTREIKIVVDSLFEDLARIRLSSEENRTTLNVNLEALKAILGPEDVAEGKSYVVTLQNIEDFKNLWSGTFNRNFRFHGDFEVKDTTKEDLEKLRRRLRKLRSR
jgi:hypothetical protein